MMKYNIFNFNSICFSKIGLINKYKGILSFDSVNYIQCFINNYSIIRNKRFFNTSNSRYNNNNNNDIIFKSDNSIDNVHSMKGYKSYKLLFDVGTIDQFIDVNNLIFKLNDFLDVLDKNIVYTLLPVVSWYDNGTHNYKGSTLCDSIKISKDCNVSDLSEKLVYELNVVNFKYGLEDINTELTIMYREWLNEDDFKMSFNVVNNIINKELRNSLPTDKNDFNMILKRINCNIQGEFTNVLMDNYGEEINIDSVISLGVVNRFDNLIYYKYKDDILIEVFISYIHNEDGILQKVNKVNVRRILNGKLSNDIFTSWIDIKNMNDIIINSPVICNEVNNSIECDNSIDNSFIRKRGNVKFFYVNGNIEYMDCFYNYPSIDVAKLEQNYNDKIGALDIETYTDNSIDVGRQVLCSVGYKTHNFYSSYVLNDEFDDRNIILELIDDIFENKLFDYKFYVHNLGRFDGVFLIDQISKSSKYDIRGIWKGDENKLLTIKIIDLKSRKSISLNDSMSFLNNYSLRTVLMSYKCNILKGIFPYSFLSKNTLNYIGKKPEFNFYEKQISNIEYNQISNNNWNCKLELLNYMKCDIEGLYEVMMILSKTMFDKYNINITSYQTLPAASKAIFTSNFYNEDDDIKVIKGNVEKDIRSAYFGGIVDSYNLNIVNNAYYYDMNSQYPYAMLEHMPVGNPIFTTEKKLDNIFGFVYGEVIPPSKDNLRVPLIQGRYKKGVIMPREPFKGWFFSEHIKDSLNYNYKFNVICGYKFKKGKNVFKKFVDTFYEDKLKAKSPVERNIAKLMLNSLYGKFGMKDIQSTLKIVSLKDADRITKNYNYSLFANLSNGKILVKYSSRISPDIKKLFKDVDNIKGNEFTGSLYKDRGVPSSIQIASAIAGYTKIGMHKFKNIPNNPCIYTDTDSIVLSNPLPDIYVGNEIGKMKLEQNIRKGIFAGKKLYCIVNDEDKLIIKASGVDSSNLSFNDFENLINGKDVTTTRNSFKVNWDELKIRIVKENITIKGKKLI